MHGARVEPVFVDGADHKLCHPPETLPTIAEGTGHASGQGLWMQGTVLGFTMDSAVLGLAPYDMRWDGARFHAKLVLVNVRWCWSSMLLALKPGHACDVISVAAEFMVTERKETFISIRLIVHNTEGMKMQRSICPDAIADHELFSPNRTVLPLTEGMKM
jgi:hypothetical protein